MNKPQKDVTPELLDAIRQILVGFREAQPRAGFMGIREIRLIAAVDLNYAQWLALMACTGETQI